MSSPAITAYADVTLRRVDEVLAGDAVSRPVEAAEQRLLQILREHIGRENAITRAELVVWLGVSDREVRHLVRGLRGIFGIHVGSDRSEGGYFIVANAAEDAQLKNPLRNQALALIQTYRRLAGDQETAELLGQLRMDLEQQENVDAAAA